MVALAVVRKTVHRRRSRERGHREAVAKGGRESRQADESHADHGGEDEGRSDGDARDSADEDRNGCDDRDDRGQDEGDSRYVEHAHPIGDEAASVWCVVLRTSKAEASA